MREIKLRNGKSVNLEWKRASYNWGDPYPDHWSGYYKRQEVFIKYDSPYKDTNLWEISRYGTEEELEDALTALVQQQCDEIDSYLESLK